MDYLEKGFDKFLYRKEAPRFEIELNEDDVATLMSHISGSSMASGVTQSSDGRLKIDWDNAKIIFNDGARDIISLGQVGSTGIKIWDEVGTKIFDVSTGNRGILDVASLSASNFFNDDDDSVTYTALTSSWGQIPVTTSFGATATAGDDVGNYFEIAFFGQSIGLVFEKANDMGKFEVEIDGIFQETVDLYSSTVMARPIVYQTSSLSNTSHTLKVTIVTKNTSSSANTIRFQGYTLFPHPGLKLTQLSLELYVYSVSVETDENGYYKGVISAPSGYSVICIVGLRTSVAKMSDETHLGPIFAWRITEYYLYDAGANSTYPVVITLLLSKI